MVFVTVWLFWSVVALPAVLLIVSQIYAMRAQDAKNRFVVLLVPDVSAERVAGEHADRFDLNLIEVWDASVKGYTALVPVRRVRALRADERVVSVQPIDTDELARRWLPE